MLNEQVFLSNQKRVCQSICTWYVLFSTVQFGIQELDDGGTLQRVCYDEIPPSGGVHCLRLVVVASFVGDSVPLAEPTFSPVPERKKKLQSTRCWNKISVYLNFIDSTIELIVVTTFSGVGLLTAFLFHSFDLQFSLASDFPKLTDKILQFLSAIFPISAQHQAL